MNTTKTLSVTVAEKFEQIAETYWVRMCQAERERGKDSLLAQRSRRYYNRRMAAARYLRSRVEG